MEDKINHKIIEVKDAIDENSIRILKKNILTKVNDDKVTVVINPGRFVTDSVIYKMPKVVQGTYAVSDFGNFIDAFKALDYEGNEMPIVKVDANTWAITNGTKLDKLS